MSRLDWLIIVLFVFGNTNGFCQLEKSISGLKEVRVMTYNIWNGFDWGKDKKRQANTLNWIASQKPDVVALQELCGYTPKRLQEEARMWGHEHSLLLKEEGYSVGLTSNQPIELKEMVRDNLWHGMLYARTYDIDFFVVHLSPADRDFRYREAGIITSKIRKAGTENFLVLGDFNAHSPFDGDFDRLDDSLLSRTRQGDAKKEEYKNLLDSEFDYSVMSVFLAEPMIDLCQRFVNANARYTFPSKALAGSWQTEAEIKRNRHRLDYIMASRTMAQRCTDVKVFNGEETDLLSDHYPVMAVFNPSSN